MRCGGTRISFRQKTEHHSSKRALCLKGAALTALLSLIVPLLLGLQLQYKFLFNDRQLENKAPFPLSRAKASRAPAVTARVFEHWKNATTQPLPCILEPIKTYMKEPKDKPSTSGLLFVRIPKTGSSTVIGVAARIANSLGKALNNNNNEQKACRLRMSHEWSNILKSTLGGLQARDKEQSFLFTIVRDPAKRALSSFFFFQVGRRGVNATEENILDTLSHTSNYQLRYIRPETPKELLSMDDSELGTVVQQTLNEFNFIGILERLDESLVLLQFVLDLSPSDILYQNAKQSGGGYDYLRCKKIVKSFTTPAIQRYQLSDEWMNLNKGDYMLYEAVNRSMDRTIDYIGRERFERALVNFRQAMALADEACEYLPPCLEEGVRRKQRKGTRCYHGDSGCGYECWDRLFENATSRPM